MIDEPDLLAEVFASASAPRLCVKSEFGFVSPSTHQPPPFSSSTQHNINASLYHCITVSLYHDTNAKPSTYPHQRINAKPGRVREVESGRYGLDLAWSGNFPVPGSRFYAPGSKFHNFRF